MFRILVTAAELANFFFSFFGALFVKKILKQNNTDEKFFKKIRDLGNSNSDVAFFAQLF